MRGPAYVQSKVDQFTTNELYNFVINARLDAIRDWGGMEPPRHVTVFMDSADEMLDLVADRLIFANNHPDLNVPLEPIRLGFAYLLGLYQMASHAAPGGR